MANDLNLFVLWANGRHKETEIINDINRHFEILQSFEITWTPKLSTTSVTFYPQSVPLLRQETAQRRQKEKTLRHRKLSGHLRQ